jgi:hypothetical protein
MYFCFRQVKHTWVFQNIFPFFNPPSLSDREQHFTMPQKLVTDSGTNVTPFLGLGAEDLP